MYKIATLILSLLLAGKANALTVNFPFSDPSFSDGKVDTLEELDTWLQQNYTGGEVTVYVAPGNYADSVRWSFDAGDNLLTITARDSENVPVFDACLNVPCIAGQLNGQFMRLEASSRRLRNITIQYLRIRNYVNGIHINRVDNAVIRHMYFEKIGSAFNNNIPVDESNKRTHNGYAAISSKDATHLVVESNTIVEAYNDDRPMLMHAVYLKSTQNASVHGNLIDMVSGDPLRFRHQCRDITIQQNVITNSGRVAVSTYERAGKECPSYDISASLNYFGMMFPYKAIYGESGFDSPWGRKPYLKEGLVQGQGYKLTVDPLLSPAFCDARDLDTKWSVFSSHSNQFVFPAADPRVLNLSTNLEVRVNKGEAYVRMSKGSELALDTNMFFVACNSSTIDTCNDNRTSDIADDVDTLNSDDSERSYYLAMEVKTGTTEKRLLLSGGGYTGEFVEVPVDAHGTWFSYTLPVTVDINRDDDAILRLRALNNGLMMKSIRLTEKSKEN